MFLRLGQSTSTSDVQPLKVPWFTFVTPGIVAVRRAVQPLKALLPMDVIRAGRMSVLMTLLSWKHWFPMSENGTVWGDASAARSS